MCKLLFRRVESEKLARRIYLATLTDVGGSFCAHSTLTSCFLCLVLASHLVGLVCLFEQIKRKAGKAEVKGGRRERILCVSDDVIYVYLPLNLWRGSRDEGVFRICFRIQPG